MQLRLSESLLTQELCSALDSAGCTFFTAGAGEVTVVHPSAADDQEAWIELTFFLRAWQAKHAAASLEHDAGRRGRPSG